MKALVKTTAAIGAAEIILIAVALVRNKYLAVTIGPEGLGIYSLLASFFQMVAMFAGTCMATGTTKYISEYYNSDRQEEMNQTFTFSVAITFGLGIILSVLFVVGEPQVRERFLSPEIAKSYYLLFVAGFVWMNLRHVFLSILQGLMQVKAVFLAQILTSVVDLLLILVFVYLFHIVGFFLSLALSPLLASILFLYFIRTRGKLRFKLISTRDPVVRQLMTFGKVNLFLGLINMGSQYLQRFLILQKMDIDSVGIFHAGMALMAYIGLVNRSSTFYFFPKMSEMMADDKRVVLINNYLFLSLVTCIPICVTAILFCRLGIRLLYSDHFLPLSSCAFWFILSQFLINIGSPFGITIVSTARLKMHTISVIAVHSLYVLVPFFWIEKYGIASLGIGVAAGQLLGMLLYFGYLRYRIGLGLSSRNVWLLILGVVGIIISKLCVDVNVFFRLVILAVFTGAVSFSLKQDEWLAIVGVVRNRLKWVLGV